jgi:putative membrane protein
VRNYLFISVAAASLILAGYAYADPPDQPAHVSPQPGTANDTVSAVKDVAGHLVGTVSAEMTTKLPDFVAAAAVSDMYEVEAGKIAQQRARDAGVRSFAAKMVTAHTESTDKLKSLLDAANISVAAPAVLDDRRQSMIDELRGATDADFDGRYLSQQIEAHNEALLLMKGFAKNGDTASVRKFAAKLVPVVRSHLNMANHLYAGLKKSTS